MRDAEFKAEVLRLLGSIAEACERAERRLPEDLPSPLSEIGPTPDPEENALRAAKTKRERRGKRA